MSSTPNVKIEINDYDGKGESTKDITEDGGNPEQMNTSIRVDKSSKAVMPETSMKDDQTKPGTVCPRHIILHCLVYLLFLKAQEEHPDRFGTSLSPFRTRGIDLQDQVSKTDKKP
jgi:hypothetical protein